MMSPQEAGQISKRESLEKAIDLTEAGQISKRESLEKAIELTGFGWFNVKLAIICGGSLGTVILESMNTSWIVPSAQCDLDMTSAQKGLFASCSFIGIVLSSLCWGFVADTTGRRNVLLFSMIGGWMVSLASSFANSFWLLTALRFVVGLIVSGSAATSYAYLGEFTNPKQSSKTIAWASTSIAIAMVILPGVAWLVLPLNIQIDIYGLNYNAWRIYIVIIGVPGLLSALALMRCPESPKWLVFAGRKDEALDVLRKMHEINVGHKKEVYPVSEIIAESSKETKFNGNTGKITRIIKMMWYQTIPIFLPPYTWTTLLGCTLQFGLYLSSVGMNLWTPEILNSLAIYNHIHPNLSSTVCDAYYTSSQSVETNVTIASEIECDSTIADNVYINMLTMGTTFTFVFILVSFIVNIFGKKTILVIAEFVSFAAGIGLKYANSTLLITVMTTLYASMPAVCISVLSSALVDLYPTNLRAMAIGIALMVGRIGTIAGSSFIGLLIDNDCSLTMIVMGSIPLVCAILCMFIPKPQEQPATSNS